MKRPRVLLVDDEAIVRDSVSEWLKNDEFEVDCACNGGEALDLVKSKRFDTAVVDLKMPGIGGLEVLKKLKETHPQMVVIIITAYGTVETAVDALKNGANDYLAKPFTLDKLEKAIEDAYTKSQASIITIEPPKPETPVETKPAVIEEPKEKAKPKTEKQCIWSKAGIISYRVCISNFKCDTCEFGQTMMDKGAQTGNRPMMMEAIKKMLEKPGPERPCRYMLSGDITHKLCPNVYQCFRCSFDQQMQERIDAKAEQMTQRLKNMKERKKTGATG
jgi:CheY-like chemotaxis protein